MELSMKDQDIVLTIMEGVMIAALKWDMFITWAVMSNVVQLMVAS